MLSSIFSQNSCDGSQVADSVIVDQSVAGKVSEVIEVVQENLHLPIDTPKLVRQNAQLKVDIPGPYESDEDEDLSDVCEEELYNMEVAVHRPWAPMQRSFMQRGTPYVAIMYQTPDDDYVCYIEEALHGGERRPVIGYAVPKKTPLGYRRSMGRALDIAIAKFKFPSAPSCIFVVYHSPRRLVQEGKRENVMHLNDNSGGMRDECFERFSVNKFDFITDMHMSAKEANYRSSANRLAEFMAEHRDSTEISHLFKKLALKAKHGLDSFAVCFADDYVKFHGKPLTRGYFARLIMTPGSAVDTRTSQYEDLIDQIQIWTSFIWIVRQAKSRLDVYTAVYLFLSSSTNSVLDKTIMSAAVASFTKAFWNSNLVQQEAKYDDIAAPVTGHMKDFVSLMNLTIDSCATDALKDLFVSAAGLKMFPAEIAIGVRRWFGRSTSTTVIGLFQDMINALMRLTRVYELVMGGVDIKEAIFQVDPIGDRINRARRLLLYRERTYIGLPVESFMDQATYLAEAQEIMNFFDIMLKKMSPGARHYRDCNSLFLELSASVMDKKTAMMAKNRTTPIAVLIHGPPGIGKSSLVDYIFNMMSHVKGREHKQSFIYERNTTSQFWEGYSPYEQPYIHYSEAGSLNPNIVSKAGDPIVAELCSVIDSLSRTADMAFDGKGKVFFLPELVVIDTNNKDLNAAQAVSNPAAIRRRFIYVEPTVKDEYKKGDTPMLDADKCVGGLPMDRWYFKVTVEEARSATESKTKVLLQNGDIHAMTALMSNIMKAHIASQNNYVDLRAALDMSLYGPFRPDPMDEVKEDFVSLGNVADENAKNFEEKHSDREIRKSVDDGIFQQWVDSDVTRDMEFSRYREIVNACNEYLGVVVPDWREDDEEKHPRQEARIEAVLLGTVTKFVLRNCSDGVRNGATKVATSCTYAAGVVFSKFQVGWHYLRYFGLSSFGFLSSMMIMAGCSIGSVCCAIFALLSADHPVIGWTHLMWTTEFWLNAVGWFSCMCGWISVFPWLGISVGLCFMRRLAKRVGYRSFYLGREWCVAQFLKGGRDVLGYLGFLGLDFSSGTTYAFIGTGLVIGYIMVHLMPKWWDRFFKEFKTEDRSNFVHESEVNEKLNEVEESHHMGKSMTKVKMASHASWPNQRQHQVKSVHQSTIEGLEQGISRNIIRAVAIDGTTARHGYVFGLVGPYAIMNTHIVGKDVDGVIVKMSTTGRDPLRDDNPTIDVRLHHDMVVNLDHDVTVLHLTGRKFRDVVKHLSVDKYLPKWADASIGGHRTKAYLDESDTIAMTGEGDSMTYGATYKYDWPGHADGMCGLPLIFQKDTGYAVGGIHALGMKGSDESRATLIYQDEVKQAIETIRSRMAIMETLEECFLDLEFDDPARKSAFCYEKLSGLEYYGKIPGAILANQVSNLKKSFLHKDVYTTFVKEVSFIPDQFFAPPMMKPVENPVYISPYNNGLKKMSLQRKSLDYDVLVKSIQVVRDHIITGLRAKGIVSLNPFNIHTAVNGDPDDPFFRRIDPSKAGGFGWPGSKRTHIPIVREDQNEILREPTTALKQRIYDITQTYAAGRAAGFVYRAQLKDEPRELSKVASGNTRLYYVSPLDALVVARMYLGPFYSLMAEHGDVFCTAIGTDMHRDADSMFHNIADFSDNIMEGDYSKYDLAMPFDIGLAACTVIYDVLKEFGYNEYALQAVRGILTDSMFPYVELLTDVFCLPALQPSGKYATAEDNSLRGILLLVYAWYAHPQLSKFDFYSYVRPLVYGDDLLASVKKGVAKHYNNVYYGQFCEEHYGMTFTSTSKGSIVAPFLTPQTMSFLKRKFRYHSGLKRIVAPLDMNSILKTLYWTMPSGAVGPDEQALSVIQSSLREIYFHVSEERFYSIRSYFISKYAYAFGVCHNQVDLSIPTYLDLSSSLVVESKNEDISSPKIPFFNTHYDLLMYESRRVEARLNKIESSVPKDLLNGGTLLDLKMSPLYMRDLRYRESIDKQVQILEEYDALHETYRRLQTCINKCSIYKVESKDEDLAEMNTGMIDMSKDEKFENVHDVGGAASVYHTVGFSTRSEQLNDTILDLSRYLERPIVLAELNMLIGTEMDYTFDIWNNFTQFPSVRAKLLTYGLMRFNLHIRISVSGTKFHSGKVLAAYTPLTRENEVTSGYWASDPFIRFNKKCFLTGTPGAASIDVKYNQPTEMTFPYVQYTPVIRNFNSSTLVIAPGAAIEDTIHMGTLYIMSQNVLEAVSPDPSSVSILIYVWATDLELGAPTGTQMTIQTESKDERITGPVERTSSALAAISQSMSSVPGIGLYARASAMVFGALTSISSLFGWSVPTINTAPMRMRPEPFQNAVQTIGYDTGHRISVDPKQEITVDPRRGAVSVDELTIKSFCERMAMIDQWNWSHSTPQFTKMWACAVNPYIVKGVVGATQTMIQPTPMGYAAKPFQFWRGDIVFTFQFVISGFHRGKYAVGYEPNINQYALIGGAIKLNKQYMQIVDLEEVQEVSVCVKWHHNRAWARVNTDELALDGLVLSDPLAHRKYANGFVYAVPATRCQSNDNSDVRINTYMSSPNMQFNVVSEENMPTNIQYLVESKNEIVECTCLDLNPSASSMEHIWENHFGEAILSFRPLCKRFVDTNDLQMGDDSATWGTVATGIFPIFPELRPSTGVTTAIRYCSVMSFVRRAFMGMSGGIKKRLRMVGMHSGGETDRFTVRLTNQEEGQYLPAIFYEDDSCAQSRQIGSLAFVPTTNGGIECEIPFYTNNLFVPAGKRFAWSATQNAFDAVGYMRYIAEWEIRSGIAGGIFVEESAAADDWTVFRFIGAPPFTIPNIEAFEGKS